MMRRSVISIIAVLLAGMMLHSCTKDAGPIVIRPDFTLVPNDTVYFTDFVLPIIQHKCWYCHPPSGNLDMGFDTAYSQLVGVESFGYPNHYRVVPFDTSASVLYHKVVGDSLFGLQMPPGVDTLSQGEKNTIIKWILQGALYN